jgi:hypothetical protein
VLPPYRLKLSGVPRSPTLSKRHVEAHVSLLAATRRCETSISLLGCDNAAFWTSPSSRHPGIPLAIAPNLDTPQ